MFMKMKIFRLKKNSWISIPSWIIIGAVLILVPIFVFMTLQSINRQKEQTTRLLVEKGAALIRSFEAGARTGMMGMHWRGFRVQRLLTETAQQPDIAYLLIADADGTILAHNDESRIGDRYGSGLDMRRLTESDKVRWREVDRGAQSPVFEVFRRFTPTRGHGQMMRHHRPGMMPQLWWQRHMNPEGLRGEVPQFIFVGLKTETVEAARREDVRHTIVMALILLLIGFAGIVSLFLAQAYRSTQVSLSRVKAFSDHLVENMPIGLAAIDQNGKLASFNQAAESILGRSFAEIFQRPAKDILPPPIQDLLAELKTGKKMLEKEIECSLPGGKNLPLEVIATSLQEETGAFVGCVVLFRDLSEIQRLKEEVTRNQRLAAVGRLAAGVAHEIRNPLSSIKGFATYFKERYKEVPQDQKTAEIMIQEVDRLNRVIGQLLEFARPMSISKTQESLPGIIRQTLKVVEGEARRKGIEFQTRIPADFPDVMLDADKIKQVLLNLCLNSVEAMANGGTLAAEVQKDDQNNRALIVIEDTGEGISAENLPHVFDPFFTTKPSGTGLGLAIVHKTIESHGGEANVASRPGGGARFSFWLPLESSGREGVEP